MAERFRQNPKATVRETDGVLFLANPAFGTLYRANETVAALWRLLEEPATADEAILVFKQAFPDEDVEALEAEITSAFFDLVEEGLIEVLPD
ncbi:MAG: PqqD family protein [Planctomycetota bacterium]|nr:PqqD family protein [Planctomycetota bacterium]